MKSESNSGSVMSWLTLFDFAEGDRLLYSMCAKKRGDSITANDATKPSCRTSFKLDSDALQAIFHCHQRCNHLDACSTNIF